MSAYLMESEDGMVWVYLLEEDGTKNLVDTYPLDIPLPLSPAQDQSPFAVLDTVLGSRVKDAGVFVCPLYDEIYTTTWFNGDAVMKSITKRCGASAMFFHLIIHLNDDHQWRREQIADWLETLDLDLTFPGTD